MTFTGMCFDCIEYIYYNNTRNIYHILRQQSNKTAYESQGKCEKNIQEKRNLTLEGGSFPATFDPLLLTYSPWGWTQLTLQRAPFDIRDTHTHTDWQQARMVSSSLFARLIIDWAQWVSCSSLQSERDATRKPFVSHTHTYKARTRLGCTRLVTHQLNKKLGRDSDTQGKWKWGMWQ